MKRIWIFNLWLLCSICVAQAQIDDEQVPEYAVVGGDDDTEPQAAPENEQVGDVSEPMPTNEEALASSSSEEPMVVIDTLLPVRKSFIRRANIIFKDRDRLKAESMRLRAEIADLNQDITKKNKQVKELSEHVNNQTFALNEAKKTAKQSQEELATVTEEKDALAAELEQAKRATVWWTIGGFVVGVGVGAVVMMLVQ